MMDKYKTYIHNPPHLFIDNAKYFVTASTLGKHPYLKTDEENGRPWITL